MQKPTKTTTNEFYIYKYLATGKKNARTARDLQRVLHKDRRTIVKQIEKERRHAADIGAVICAEVWGRDRGYYLAANAAEGLEYCGVLEHREGEIRNTRQALESVLNGSKELSA